MSGLSEWTANNTVMEAVFSNRPKVLTVLISNGVDPNFIQDGITSLSHAARYGFVNVAKVLLDYGIDPNIHDRDMLRRFFKTPLIHACQQGHIDMVKLLLEYGANVEEQDNHGFTPMYFAILHNYNNIVKLLIKYGAQLHTDYMIALRDDAVFNTLLNSGLDTESTTNLGYLEYLESLNKNYYRNMSPYRNRNNFVGGRKRSTRRKHRK